MGYWRQSSRLEISMLPCVTSQSCCLACSPHGYNWNLCIRMVETKSPVSQKPNATKYLCIHQILFCLLWLGNSHVTQNFGFLFQKRKVASVTDLHTSAKSQNQALNVGSHITPRKKQREINVCVLVLSLISLLIQSRTPNQGMVLPLFRLDLPTSVRAIEITSHRLTHGLPWSRLPLKRFSYQCILGCVVYNENYSSQFQEGRFYAGEGLFNLIQNVDIRDCP